MIQYPSNQRLYQHQLWNWVLRPENSYCVCNCSQKLLHVTYTYLLKNSLVFNFYSCFPDNLWNRVDCHPRAWGPWNCSTTIQNYVNKIKINKLFLKSCSTSPEPSIFLQKNQTWSARDIWNFNCLRDNVVSTYDQRTKWKEHVRISNCTFLYNITLRILEP